jgi:hypothetical protein
MEIMVILHPHSKVLRRPSNPQVTMQGVLSNSKELFEAFGARNQGSGAVDVANTVPLMTDIVT